MEHEYMRLALRLAQRGYGLTSPNPMVGAVLVRRGRIIGRGWHHRAGEPHAEIEALRDAQKRGYSPGGATLYVTLEPCCTQGRTPPCTEAIIAAGITKVVAGATDPNPQHCGKGFKVLRRAGISVRQGVLAKESTRLNDAFNHWIVHRTPLVTVKAGMTLDGKIATASGESRWITGEQARTYAMKLRQGADAILVGINTVLADDPSLTVRNPKSEIRPASARLWRGENPKEIRSPKSEEGTHMLRRIVLDSQARTPLNARVVSDECAALTTIVVSRSAPARRVAALAKRVNVLIAPSAIRASAFKVQGSRFKVQGSRPPPSLASRPSPLDLRWLLWKLGAENVTSLLVEGGGEVNASFLFRGLAQRVAFFYAPKILGGRDSRPAVAGEGARALSETLDLTDIEWQKVGEDWLLTARIENR